MIARIAFFLSLVLTVVALFWWNTPPKEVVSYNIPSGYAKAQNIPVALPDSGEIVSALDYAQALNPLPEVIPSIKAPPVVKKAVKFSKRPKRQIARAKSKRRTFLRGF